MTTTPIRDACEAVEADLESVAAENRERYRFCRMLAATDRLLWVLEGLNLAGIERIPRRAAWLMRESLDDLPRSCLVAFVVSDRVQKVLDGVFAVQEALLRLRHPERAEEEVEPDADVQGPILHWLRQEPGSTMSRLRDHFSGHMPYDVLLATVQAMVAEGTVRAERVRNAGGRGRWVTAYYVAEEVRRAG